MDVILGIWILLGAICKNPIVLVALLSRLWGQKRSTSETLLNMHIYDTRNEAWMKFVVGLWIHLGEYNS